MANLNGSSLSRRGKLAVALSLLLAGVGETLWDSPVSQGLAGLWDSGVASAWAGSEPYGEAELRSVETKTEAKVREIREQEIDQLKATLARRLPQNRRADLYFRLAESYREAYEATFKLEGRVHEKRLARGVPEEFIDRSRSKPFLRLGIRACEEVLDSGVSYPQMDEIHYFLGFNYRELKQEKESLKHFGLLVSRYPRSVYTVEALRELGDAAYRATQFRQALKNYADAIGRLQSLQVPEEATSSQKNFFASQKDGLPRLLFKQAWTQYRLRQFDRAVASLKEAVTAAGKEEKLLSVREEALRDMALFMTETGQVAEALDYFGDVVNDSRYYPMLLERFGKQYERNVETEKAIQVYESLLKTNPDAEAAFRVRVKLVDLDLRREAYAQAIQRLRSGKLLREGEPETVTAAQNLKAMVRRTATEKHEAFRKKGRPQDLALAENFYTAYLELFLLSGGGDSKAEAKKEAAEIRMYLADVKRELGKANEASELYRQVLESQDSRYSKEAGALWIASLSEAIKKAAPPAGVVQEKPTAIEEEFIEAADRMDDALQGTPEAREVSLRAAQVLAGYKKTQDDAIERCEELIKTAPQSPQAVTAARLWLQLVADRLAPASLSSSLGKSLEDTSEGSELRELMDRFKQNTALMSADASAGGKLKLALQEWDSKLRVSSILSLEKEKDHAGAARGYEAFADQASSREIAEKAWANAMGAYLKAGDRLAVERVSARWLKTYPASPKALESVRSTATQALVQGDLDFSISLFEKLGRDVQDAEALETAARLSEGNADFTRMKKNYEFFLSRYATSPRRFAVMMALAQQYEREKQESKAAALYKSVLAGAPELEAEASARLAELHLGIKDTEQGKKLLAKVAGAPLGYSAKTRGAKDHGAKTRGAEGPVSPYVAYARFRQAELLELENQLPKLKLPEAELRKSLTARLQFLEVLGAAYGKAVEAGGPWAVSALDHLARWAWKFAEEMDAVSLPEGASEKVVANYRASFKQVSDPLRKKAIGAWADAYRKAQESEILSPALPSIADRLASSAQAGVGRAQGFRGRFRLSGLSPDGGKEGAQVATERVRDRLLAEPKNSGLWVDYGNLLWGQGKPLLARVAYERALALNPKNVSAINNRAVSLVSGSAQEDPLKAWEALALLKSALKTDEFFIAAKFNMAALLNYYRLFAKAKPYWEQVVRKLDTSDAWLGLAIARQGLGETAGANEAFAKVTADPNGWALSYHRAAREKSDEACVQGLEPLTGVELKGFEKSSYETLRSSCAELKKP